MVDESGYEIRGAWCQMCGVSHTKCYTRCYLERGLFKHVEGCPQAGNNASFGSRSLCAKGMAAPRLLNTQDRLLYPMRRVGEKGPGASFERISWDEALDTIAGRMLEQKDQYGPESFGILSPQSFPPLAHLGRRLLNVHGSPNYLHSAICYTQRQSSANTVLGGPNLQAANHTTVPEQLERTRLLVSWGVNHENAAVNQGRPRRRLQQQKNGMKVIDIRPMCDTLASKADIWLPVRPGTDLALALGILHVIVGEGLYDHAFVRDWCHGFDDLADHVRVHTPEWAAERCGIEAERIREVARMMATIKPMGIDFGNGIGDQARDGHWTVCAVQLIGAITGNVGVPGGGCDALRLPMMIPFDGRPKVLPERLPLSEEDRENGWPAGASKLVCPEYPRWYMAPGAAPTSTYLGGLRSVLTGEPYPLRTIFAHATNPLSATRQPKLVEQALLKVDFFFTMDMYRNPSCDYADIVLPACSQYECSHQMAVRNMPEGTFIGMNQKLQDPPGEAMSDWEVYLKLAQHLGYGEDFWGGDIESYLAEQADSTGYTLEELRGAPEGIFVARKPADENGGGDLSGKEAPPDYAGLFRNLPHGKVQCMNEVVGGKPDVRGEGSLPYLPEYLGPIEGLAETPELAVDYPLIFSDVHAYRTSTHSWLGDIGWLRELQPDPWVRINPVTAARCGIEDGQWVRIESPHGWVKLKAQLFEGVSPEVLMGRRGWWQACEEISEPGYGWFDGGAETNVLYADDERGFDRFHSSMGKQTLVRISPWKEADKDDR